MIPQTLDEAAIIGKAKIIRRDIDELTRWVQELNPHKLSGAELVQWAHAEAFTFILIPSHDFRRVSDTSTPNCKPGDDGELGVQTDDDGPRTMWGKW